jgi:hypothetical protein
VYLNYEENLEKLEETLEVIVTIMAKCEFYATLYTESLLKPSDATHTLLASLPELMPEFYCSIIVFTVKAQSYFSPTSVIRKFLQLPISQCTIMHTN